MFYRLSPAHILSAGISHKTRSGMESRALWCQTFKTIAAAKDRSPKTCVPQGSTLFPARLQRLSKKRLYWPSLKILRVLSRLVWPAEEKAVFSKTSIGVGKSVGFLPGLGFA
jgi:hypothetical protein